LDLCRKGNRNAFDELMRRYEKKVYNFAYRLCGNYDEANDIASESFVRVYNAISNFRGDSAFITWLFRIVNNVYLDEKKRKRNHPTQSLEEYIQLEESSVNIQVEDMSPTPSQLAERKMESELIQSAINKLPDYQRLMIILYHFEERSYEEIAEIMGLPLGTVKSRLNRARLALKDILAPIKEHFTS
jgi:RNA polymerase sigma-70 factor (ECF subfamily)